MTLVTWMDSVDRCGLDVMNKSLQMLLKFQHLKFQLCKIRPSHGWCGHTGDENGLERMRTNCTSRLRSPTSLRSANFSTRNILDVTHPDVSLDAQ